MSARLVQRHAVEAELRESWSINGEVELLVRHRGTEAFVTIARLRHPTPLEAAYTLLETTAVGASMLRRIEPTIDGRFIVIDRADLETYVEGLAQHRFGDKDFESLTVADAQQSILRLLAASGGSLGADGFGEMLKADAFPLGYQVRDAVLDLEKRGAIEIIQRRGEMSRLKLRDTTTDNRGADR